MNKMTFLIPYREMEEVVRQTFWEQNQDGDDWELETVLAEGTFQVDESRIHGDVVVARGGTYRKLKNRLHNIPVTELLINGYDVMRAVAVCKKKYSPKKIAFVGTDEMVYGAKNISELLSVLILTAEAYEEDDVRHCLRIFKEKGVRTMIGGVTATRIASELQMQAVRIDSGEEAVYQAISEAKRVFGIYRQERERTEMFRTILDYTSDGIVAINKDQRIILLNHEAANITGVSSQITGKKIEKVLPDIKLEKVLEMSKPRFHEIIKVNNQDITINSIPLTIEDKSIGAIATFQPITKVQDLGNEIRRQKNKRGHVAKFSFEDILGECDGLKRTIQLAKQYSKTDANILITGETGTGKEVFAQSIHSASRRSREPFVAINCAVLSENLLESELFGYVEGAFTDARKGGKSGLFEAAHNGTLFLDEISEISPRMQGLLLRVLQEHEIMRVGDDRIIPVNVRIIVATNRDLAKMSREGEFRLDLYYRLDTLHLVLPPLRERNRDVIILFRHFLNTIYGNSGIIWQGMTRDAEALLMSCHWTGNIRELYNIAERVAVFTEGAELDVSSLQTALTGNVGFAATPEEKETSDGTMLIPDVVDEELMAALAKAHNHYGEAAKILGISRTTLWRRLKKMKK